MKPPLLFTVFTCFFLILMYVTIGIPNIAGQSQEAMATTMLKFAAGKNAMVGFFVVSGANWRHGTPWSRGAAYDLAGDPSTCALDCDSALQVGFDHWNGVCVVYGDVVTMRFKTDGSLKAWSVDPAADGC